MCFRRSPVDPEVGPDRLRDHLDLRGHQPDSTHRDGPRPAQRLDQRSWYWPGGLVRPLPVLQPGCPERALSIPPCGTGHPCTAGHPLTAPHDGNRPGPTRSKGHLAERWTAGHGWCRTIKDRLGVMGPGTASSMALDLRRAHWGTPAWNAAASARKLRCWSSGFPALARSPEDNTDLVRLTVLPGLASEPPAWFAVGSA